MKIVIRQIHAADSKSALNEEWFVIENAGDKTFSTSGCSVAVGKGKQARLKPIGTLDPGFSLGPAEKMRVVTGNPGKKAHGKVPEDGVKNYHLFLATPLLAGPGSVVAVSLNQHEVTRATYDPSTPDGVAKTSNGA